LILQRTGVDLPLATLENRMIQADSPVLPVVKLLRDRWLANDIR
jgi:hypothetical protein